LLRFLYNLTVKVSPSPGFLLAQEIGLFLFNQTNGIPGCYHLETIRKLDQDTIHLPARQHLAALTFAFRKP